jgi:hypothetical protein
VTPERYILEENILEVLLTQKRNSEARKSAAAVGMPILPIEK